MTHDNNKISSTVKMSKGWSNDYMVSEHRDLQANTMAVDVTGSNVLLAGRRYFAIKHLDEETDCLKKFHRQSKYEVGTAEWNPILSHSHLCAVSSNTRVEILSFDGAQGYELQTTHSLRAHTRAVSDLNWHPKDPEIIATCSIDTFINIWDLRDQRKPSLSCSTVAGSSQVRWNVLSPNTFATAHDGDVKIWDQRKGNSPVQYIAAHLTKIYGLDWCPFQQNQLATSSQDCTVKIFDTTNPRRAESILTTNSPVWRARYTPFGEGLVTIVVPQLRRGENSLSLWNISNLNTPIYTFVGHTDVVLEFQWRQQRLGNNDFELITYSKDQCLRIYKIAPFLKKLCGHDIDDNTSVYTQLSEDSNLRSIQSVPDLQLHESNSDQEINYTTTKIENSQSRHELNSVDNDKDVPSPTQPKTLQQEFSLININIPNIEVNAMDAVERSCTVTANNKNYNVVLKVNFPGNYPYSAQPTFQFCPGTTIDHATMAKLLKVLKQTAQQRVRKNRSCLEPCLRQLIATLEQTCVKDESESNHLGYHMQQNFMDSSNTCSNYHDSCIPFPRTSGAKFCSAGTLVCFGRSSYARRTSMKSESATPRALAALGTGMNNGGHFMPIYPTSYAQPSDNISISSFYFQDRPKTSRRGIHGTNRTHGKPTYKNYHSVVTIYDASSLFFINKDLAEKYTINMTDIPAMCHHNASIAAAMERPDLVQAWYLTALVISQPTSNAQGTSNGQSTDNDIPWSTHPFGQNLIHSLIQHYSSQSDVQMAGMLSCAFNGRFDTVQSRLFRKSVNITRLFNGKLSLKPGESPYHTIHPADTSLEGWNFPSLKQNRSNSWSDSLDDAKIIQDNSGDHDRNSRSIDEKNITLYDGYKKAYAEVLHRWKLLDTRAQVLKNVNTAALDPKKSIEFQSDCTWCNKTSKGLQCTNCKRLTFECAICHISVRGPSNFCVVCGHGGHTQHLATWFTSENICPTGCGCFCIQESTILFHT